MIRSLRCRSLARGLSTIASASTRSEPAIGGADGASELASGLSSSSAELSTHGDEMVRVSLPGQGEVAIPSLWLKLNDPSRITHNGQRTFEIADVVTHGCSRVLSHSCSAEGGLRVEWQDGTAASLYSLSWLAHHLPQPRAEATQVHAPEMRLWDASLAKRLPDIQVAFAELESPSSGGLLRVSAQLATYGISFVRGVPVEPGMVEVVGELVGAVRRTNYGTTFDVIDLGLEGGNNLAQVCASLCALAAAAHAAQQRRGGVGGPGRGTCALCGQTPPPYVIRA